MYILILGFTIVVDYYVGLFLEQQQDLTKKKFILFASIIVNVGVLCIFKYFNFINENISGLLHYIGISNPIPFLKIILPIGLSFHTFQAMSYTIEVYRGNQKAEKHFGYYALYVMFYPQLVAGPIERPQHILHQLHENHSFSFENMRRGISLILFGLVKKVVIADRLAFYVDDVYHHIGEMSFIPTLLAVFFFSIQIYCDFSGYSDIALGTARCMGIDLMQNFNYPYRATSIADFWRRWHISLSTWFRDYLYFPLGGSRVTTIVTIRNVLIVFVISGIWHGASWTFVVWGLLHAIFQVTELVRNKYLPWFRLQNKFLAQTFIFLLVSVTWIFFRASNFKQALQVFKNLFAVKIDLHLTEITANKGPYNLVLCFGALLLLYVMQNIPTNIYKTNTITSWVCACLLLIILGKNNAAQFIYFQF
ncbi:MAG: MBOAT family O-acyltransferase [Flavitalea sp.]